MTRTEIAEIINTTAYIDSEYEYNDMLNKLVSYVEAINFAWQLKEIESLKEHKDSEKLLLEKIWKLTNAISAIQMLIEEDIEERKGFTFNRKKMLDIAEEALK